MKKAILFTQFNIVDKINIDLKENDKIKNSFITIDYIFYLLCLDTNTKHPPIKIMIPFKKIKI